MKNTIALTLATVALFSTTYAQHAKIPTYENTRKAMESEAKPASMHALIQYQEKTQSTINRPNLENQYSSNNPYNYNNLFPSMPGIHTYSFPAKYKTTKFKATPVTDN